LSFFDAGAAAAAAAAENLHLGLKEFEFEFEFGAAWQAVLASSGFLLKPTDVTSSCG
jgi:hypothetical protein